MYDICNFYFLGKWFFWTTSRKETGYENGKTHELGYNISLLQAEFRFFKALVYASKLLLLRKNTSAMYYYSILADEHICWLPF